MSSLRSTTFVLSAVTAGALVVAGGVIAPAFGAPDYPSWADVQAAKSTEEATRAAVTDITDLVVGLQASADEAGIVALKRAETYAQAQVELDAATEKLDTLTHGADEAAARALTSRMRAGLLASHLARAGGGDMSVQLFLNGDDADDADDMLHQLSTASKLSESTRATYADAVADGNSARALGDQASIARTELGERAEEAAEAHADAAVAAQAAEAAVAEQRRKNDELLAQLALLKDTTAAVEAAYIEGLTRPPVVVPAASGPAPGAKASTSTRAASPVQPAQSPAPAPAPAPAAPPPAAPAPPPAAPAPAPVPAPPAPAPAPAPPVTVAPPRPGIAQGAIDFARRQIGLPYELGGAGPGTWDCSGLMMKAFSSVGVYIGTHSVTNQYNTLGDQGKLVPFSQRQAGDIIFWGSLNGSKYHDAIYVGGNQIIAAPKPGDVVKQQPLWGSDIVPFVGRPAG